MKKTIYFDMDGTFVNFYGVEGWLTYLLDEDTTPYEVAKPLFRMCDFARVLHRLQKTYRIGVISWGCKDASAEYDKAVERVKREWLANHLPSVEFDEIHILHYGTPKESVATANDILFDDEERNRNNWNGTSYDAIDIIKRLREM